MVLAQGWYRGMARRPSTFVSSHQCNTTMSGTLILDLEWAFAPEFSDRPALLFAPNGTRRHRWRDPPG